MGETCEYCGKNIDLATTQVFKASIYHEGRSALLCSKQCQMAFIAQQKQLEAKDNADHEARVAESLKFQRENPELYAKWVHEAWVDEHKLWNGNFFLHVAAFTVGWIIFSSILKYMCGTGIGAKFNPAIVNFFAALCGFGSIPISLAQNIFICKNGIDYDDYKTWYLPPIAIIVLILGLSVVANKVGSGMQAAGAKKARTAFEKVYKPEMDIILGKELITYEMADDGTVKAKEEVLFGKDGLAFGKAFQFDLDKHLIVVGKGKKAQYYRYCNNGIAIGNVPSPKSPYTSLKSIYPVKDAKFSAETSTEVIGKTFTGAWNDDTATIKFGKDGKASVVFGDGSKASGSYLASDDENIVLYNHRDKGLWYVFSYNDKDDAVNMWFAGKVKRSKAKVVKSNSDWKKN